MSQYRVVNNVLLHPNAEGVGRGLRAKVFTRGEIVPDGYQSPPAEYVAAVDDSVAPGPGDEPTEESSEPVDGLEEAVGEDEDEDEDDGPPLTVEQVAEMTVVELLIHVGDDVNTARFVLEAERARVDSPPPRKGVIEGMEAIVGTDAG